GKEQHEREQVDADEDQQPIADPADDVVDHGAVPSAASVRADVSRSRRRQANHAGTMAATNASTSRGIGHHTGWFHSAILRARSSGASRREALWVRNI